jgi:drug/metabolite transporter (DMT)-like permease
MVYLLSAVALLCLTIKGYCGKKTGTYVNNAGDSVLFNLVRMILCVLIGLAVVFFECSLSSLAVDSSMIAICLFAGISNAAFLVGWLLAIQKNAMVTVDVALTVGSIIPSVLCALLFDDSISLTKMIGFGFIILATAVLSGYNKSMKKKVGVLGALLLVIAAVGDGLTGFCQQLYKHYYTEGGKRFDGASHPNSVYQFYTFLFAALILFVLFAAYSIFNRSKLRSNGSLGVIGHAVSSLKKPLPHIFVMAVCMFAASYFQTLATSTYGMSAQILYPIMKGGCLITVNVTAMLFFGEKPNARSIAGSILALIGIFTMNLL